MVRTFPVRASACHELCCHSVLIGPMLGPVVGGLIVHYLNWRAIFFVNLPIGLIGLYLVYRHLPDYRVDRSDPLDWVGLVLFSSGVALLSYVLEVFGEHTLGGREILGLLGISLALLAGYGRHAATTKLPLLRLALFRIRTFRVSVSGSFVTRLGAGGVPFLLPLLYQVGLSYTPVQAALLIVPQPLAAMSLKMTVPRILVFRISPRVDLEHSVYGRPYRAVCNHRAGHAGLADPATGISVWFRFIAAIQQHEHPGICRR